MEQKLLVISHTLHRFVQVSGSDSVVAEDSSFPGCLRCVAQRTLTDVSKKTTILQKAVKYSPLDTE